MTALDVLGAGRIWWTVVFDGREQVDLPTPPSFVAEASSFEPSHGFVLDLEFERAPTVPWTADTEPSTVGTGSQSY